MFASWQLRLTRAPDLYGVFWRAIWCHLGTPRWRGPARSGSLRSSEVQNEPAGVSWGGLERRASWLAVSLVVSARFGPGQESIAPAGSLRSDEVRRRRGRPGFPTPCAESYLDTVALSVLIGFQRRKPRLSTCLAERHPFDSAMQNAQIRGGRLLGHLTFVGRASPTARRRAHPPSSFHTASTTTTPPPTPPCPAADPHSWISR
jgi:hypothetical protein